MFINSTASRALRPRDGRAADVRVQDGVDVLEDAGAHEVHVRTPFGMGNG
jgi:hypothetical protein